MSDRPEIRHLYHRLNNQLNIVLAQAELLESKLTGQPNRVRATQVVTAVLETMTTARELRTHIEPEDSERS